MELYVGSKQILLLFWLHYKYAEKVTRAKVNKILRVLYKNKFVSFT